VLGTSTSIYILSTSADGQICADLLRESYDDLGRVPLLRGSHVFYDVLKLMIILLYFVRYYYYYDGGARESPPGRLRTSKTGSRRPLVRVLSRFLTLDHLRNGAIHRILKIARPGRPRRRVIITGTTTKTY